MAANESTTADASIARGERTIWHRLLLLAGSLGPLGHSPASGSVTVLLVGVPAAWFMRANLALGWYLAVVVAFTVASVWIHDVGDRLLGEKDSRKLVWDELCGFFVAVAIAPLTWQIFAVGYVVQRVFDIAKVPPANVIERKVRGGLGVVGDDLIAGIYALLVLLAVERWVPAGAWSG